MQGLARLDPVAMTSTIADPALCLRVRKKGENLGLVLEDVPTIQRPALRNLSRLQPCAPTQPCETRDQTLTPPLFWRPGLIATGSVGNLTRHRQGGEIKAPRSDSAHDLQHTGVGEEPFAMGVMVGEKPVETRLNVKPARDFRGDLQRKWRPCEKLKPPPLRQVRAANLHGTRHGHRSDEVDPAITTRANHQARAWRMAATVRFSSAALIPNSRSIASASSGDGSRRPEIRSPKCPLDTERRAAACAGRTPCAFST